MLSQLDCPASLRTSVLANCYLGNPIYSPFHCTNLTKHVMQPLSKVLLLFPVFLACFAEGLLELNYSIVQEVKLKVNSRYFQALLEVLPTKIDQSDLLSHHKDSYNKHNNSNRHFTTASTWSSTTKNYEVVQSARCHFGPQTGLCWSQYQYLHRLFHYCPSHNYLCNTPSMKMIQFTLYDMLVVQCWSCCCLLNNVNPNL